MPDVPAFPPFPPLPRLQRMQVFGGMYFHGPTFEVCMFLFLLFSQVVLGLLCLFKQFVLCRPFFYTSMDPAITAEPFMLLVFTAFA